jgi:hypothetical protein
VKKFAQATLLHKMALTRPRDQLWQPRAKVSTRYYPLNQQNLSSLQLLSGAFPNFPLVRLDEWVSIQSQTCPIVLAIPGCDESAHGEKQLYIC